MNMIDRKKALQDLHDKVAAGELTDIARPFHLAMGGKEYHFEMPNALLAGRAYSGSLDAAKALHDAVLEGSWAFIVYQDTCQVHNREAAGEYHGDCIDNPARAWLIAIIKALIAKEQNT